MKRLTKGLVMVVTCIMLISLMPVTIATEIPGGSDSDVDGSAIISGTSGVYTITSEKQVTFDSVPLGEKALIAEIRSEAYVPATKTGTAFVEWTVDHNNDADMTKSGTDNGYDYALTVGALGTTYASVDKTSKAGIAHSISQIYARAVADATDGSVEGTAFLNSEAYLTGTGLVTANAEGSATYSASTGTTTMDMDRVVSGNVEGMTALEAGNKEGGVIGGYFILGGDANLGSNPAYFGNDIDGADLRSQFPHAYAFTGVEGSAEVDHAYSQSANLIGLGATRSSKNGDTYAYGSLSSTNSATADVYNFNGLVTKSANVGCNGDQPIQVDLTGNENLDYVWGAGVAAPVSGDKAYSNVGLYVDAFSEADLATEPETNANGLILGFSAAKRTATCCNDGNLAQAYNTIASATWDATATIDEFTPVEQETIDAMGVCIYGQTGKTRDGDPKIATIPGMGTGVNTVTNKGWLAALTGAAQTAHAEDGIKYTATVDALGLQAPKYDSRRGTIDDVAGAYFAIDSMQNVAFNGAEIEGPGTGNTIQTDVTGPDAMLWINAAEKTTINGHYADDGISLYEPYFDPEGYGEAYGPEIAAGSLPIALPWFNNANSRKLALVYGTWQSDPWMDVP